MLTCCVITGCDNGDILLKIGTEISFIEGRVEICYMNEYMSVCDDQWDVRDAQVVCRQLNFSGTCEFKVVICGSEKSSIKQELNGSDINMII